MGPFPASGQGRQNKYLLVVVDELSKWIELFPMREASAKLLTDALEDGIFLRYGKPGRIVTDNGSQFTSKTMERLCPHSVTVSSERSWVIR